MGSSTVDDHTGKRVYLSARSCAGVTLFELLIASSLALVVILAIGQVDVTRVRMVNQVTNNVQPEAELALASIVKEINAADRIKLWSTGTSSLNPYHSANYCPTGQASCTAAIFIRVPIGTDFDNLTSNNYRWEQYSFNSTAKEVRYYTTFPAALGGVCTPTARYHSINGATMQFWDQTISPPGSDPFGGPDNNTLQITITVTDPTTGAVKPYTGQATLRSAGYTNVGAADPANDAWDTGLGLTQAGVSDPPTYPCQEP